MDLLIRRKKCPKCENGSLQSRVKRNFWVKLFLFWLPIKRYRCDFCDRKSYVLGDVRQYLYVVDIRREEKVAVVAHVKQARARNVIRETYFKQHEICNSEHHKRQEVIAEQVETIRVENLPFQLHSDREAELFLQKILEETGGKITLQMSEGKYLRD